MSVANPARRGTFALAFEAYISDLKRNEDVRSPFYREVLSQFSSGATSDAQQSQTLERLVQYVRGLDEKQKSSSFTRRISARLDPLVIGLSQYTKAFDVMIQAGPAAACLLYGGARIVLQLAENFRKCFEDVLSIMESVGHLLKCYHVFSTAYEASADMQQLLLEAYKNIISFWQKASALFSRKAYKTLLKGIVKPLDAEWQRCRQTLEADEKRVQMFAQATEASMRRLRDLEESANQQAKVRTHIINWIKAGQDEERLDVRQDIRKHLETRHDSSCAWLFQHPDMEQWLKAKKSTSIWYNASPGAGKTILASALVGDLQSQKYRTATFFCSFNDPVRRKAINVLRSLALQLLSPSDSIPERVKRLYEEDLKNHCSKLVDPKTATEVIEILIRQQSRIHMVVDGLDECEDRGLLLHSLCHLLHAKTYGIAKWFFSSRPDSDIRLLMRAHHVKELVASQELLIDDIRKYVTHRLRTTMDHDCESSIEHWTDNSEGCFLWVRHMLDILEGEDTTCGDEIEEELARFPTGLTGCYMRTLSRLSTRPPRHQQLARSIFILLVGAVQPLRLSELAHALAALKSPADFSAGSLPKPELIEELCSSLIIFDRTTQGTEGDPLLKVAHKSVQEFFLQDPDALQLKDERLREFFVTPAIANLELGLSALSYLNYRRYQEPQDMHVIIGADEHAFLRHAAAFWHHYLREAVPSAALSKQVVDFVKSGAFWSSVAVQSQIAPYLFARYTRRFSGYHVDATGPKNLTRLSDDISFAIPLPEWLDAEDDLEGAKVVEALHGFITEWHSVLNSHPKSLDQCAMSSEWCDLLPGRALWADSRARVFNLPSAAYSHSELVDVRVENYSLKVAVHASKFRSGEQVSEHSDQHLDCSVRPILVLHTTPLEQECLDSEELDSMSMWVVDTNFLSAGYHPSVSDVEQPEPQLYSPMKAQGQWRVLYTSIGRNYQGSLMPHRLMAYHCMEEKLVAQDTFSTSFSEESGYGSMTSSDTEFDSDEEEDPGTSAEQVRQHCLLVIQEHGPPHWHFWKSKPNMEVGCASHPKDNIVLWSESPHQLFTMKLDSGKIQSSILPEPVDVQLSTACAIRKDFRFSESGDILHYLLYTTAKSEGGMKHTVSVSSFVYCDTQDADLERTHPDTSFSYESASSLEHPFILTHWDYEFVYIALPCLSCNTKMVKVRLTKAADSTQEHKENIQTLRDPIFFPYSTPYRSPMFKVQPHQPGEDVLILGLNEEKLSTPTAQVSKPPTVMTWRIDSQEGWRRWDEKVDARDESAAAQMETYDLLRGNFLDKNKRFDVTVRSGLDWRRKAFLSCA